MSTRSQSDQSRIAIHDTDRPSDRRNIDSISLYANNSLGAGKFRLYLESQRVHRVLIEIADADSAVSQEDMIGKQSTF